MTATIHHLRRPSAHHYATSIRLRRHAALALVRGDAERAARWSYRAWQAECAGDEALRAELRLSVARIAP